MKSGAQDEIIGRLNAAVNTALAKQKVRRSFASLGYEPAGGTPAEFGALIASQVAYWAKIVKDSGIKMPQ